MLGFKIKQIKPNENLSNYLSFTKIIPEFKEYY